MDYGLIAKEVAKAANRALGSIIAKSKAYGGLPYSCFTKLFNSLVKPIIDYSAGVWGFKGYSCINAVYYRACRYFLGVGKYTPNVAVLCEMGWDSPLQAQWHCLVKQWFRMCNMNDNRLCKRVFQWATQISNNKKNWVYHVKQHFNEIGMAHLANISYTFTDENLSDFDMVMRERNEDDCFARINATGSVVPGRGGNKLRLYKKLKHDITGTEAYVKLAMGKKHRSAYAKFRCGVAPLNIELGRYRQSPVEQRLCPMCDTNNVEDESHVLLVCPLYNDIRNSLYDAIVLKHPDFNELNNDDKIILILSSEDCIKDTAKACADILFRRRCFMYAI